MSFSPPRWLANAHVQTLSAALPGGTARFSPTEIEELTIELPSHGALAATAWWHPGARPTVLLVHGLGSTSEAPYVVRAGAWLYRAGYHVVRLNLRGAGAGVWWSDQMYHAGIAEDPQTALAWLARSPRVSSLLAIGFSLGGQVLLKLAAEWGEAPPSAVDAVVTVSSPLDLAAGGRLLERRRVTLYRRYLLDRMKAIARLHRERYPASAPLAKREIDRLQTLREFDERVVAPHHGFAGADDYYEKNAAGPRLHRVRVPTLIIHAEDDPMVPAETVRPFVAAAGPGVRFEWTRLGGHVGFFGDAGVGWSHNWPMARAIEFAQRHARLHASRRAPPKEKT